MLHNPSVLKEAQAELDSVVGSDRMPEFDDADSLPYIRALVNETLRWRPVAVLGGTPHAVTTDDVYNGMCVRTFYLRCHSNSNCRFIPKGSTVFANLS